MARTSRKRKSSEGLAVSANNSCFLTAFYLRLSNQDEIEHATTSIENQKSILTDFISDKPEFELVEVFQDIGKTGTNFERPGFELLMQAVREGKINCIIVKDLSRFGRNFIENGEYIEKIFPYLKVRFIAVTDVFDTMNASFADNSFIVPIKNIMNENYARDISVKERSSKKVLRQSGRFIGSQPIYGYIKSPENKHKLIIDTEVAPVVRKIYDMCEAGCSDNAIAKYLNNQKVPSPAKYKFDKGLLKHEKYNVSRWYPQTVRQILTSRVYVGDVVQGVYMSAEMKGKKRVVSEDQWDISPDQHEAIISHCQFDRVTEIRAARREKYLETQGQTVRAKISSITGSGAKQNNILSGKLFCADCHTALERKYIKNSSKHNYFICGVHDKTRTCSRKYIAEDELHQSLYAIIKSRIDIILGVKVWLVQRHHQQLQKVQELDAGISRMKQEITRLSGLKLTLYHDWKSGIIDSKDFQYRKSCYKSELAAADVSLNQLVEKRKDFILKYSDENMVVKAVSQIANQHILTKEMCDIMISRIEVYEYNRIKVYFNFEDELRDILRYITNVEHARDCSII